VAFKRHRYQIEPRYDTPKFRRVLDNIARDESSIVASLKEDTTASVWRIEHQDQPIVVKRYNTQNLWHAIRRSFRQSRADNCRKMTTQFMHAGIVTAPNVAVIQEWIGPFKLRSWFICEFFPGKALTSYFDDQDLGLPRGTELQTLKKNVSGLFESLRKARLSHGDLKATNILLSGNQLCLIDLDAAHTHKNNNSFQRAHKKDQARFMKNWLPQADIYKMFEPLVTNSSP